MGAGGARRTDSGEWGYPPSRPFALLVTYFGIGATQLLLTVLNPPLPGTPVALQAFFAGVCVLQALVTLGAWLGHATWALTPITASGVLVASASAATAAGGQGQLIAGFYLAVLGMFAGYFLTTEQVRLLLVLATVTYGGALAFNPRLDTAAYVLALAVLVVGVTLVVSSLVQRLRAEAVRDPLTGAFNRRGMHIAAEAVHEMDTRRHEGSVIVGIDLDGFKAFNDRHGHQAGDHLLEELVADWSTVLRASDILSRVGGDEFVLILPCSQVEEAQVLIARMQEANPFPWSAGVTRWTPDEPMAAALQRADAALYLDKGR